MFTEPLESVSQEIVDKGREYLGIEFNFIDYGLHDEEWEEAAIVNRRPVFPLACPS